MNTDETGPKTTWPRNTETHGNQKRGRLNAESHGIGEKAAFKIRGVRIRILVEDRVVVELKAVESLTKAHEAQLLNYLKASGKRVGLLVNFTHPKAEIRRFVL
jgi:hypothetical protein